MKPSQLTAKNTPLYLLQLSCSIFDQLQLEEALLRSDDRNWCIINHGTPPAIVMGISGKTDLLINNEKISRIPVPIIRRFSGGGTVFIDKNTYLITWICNSACTNIECNPGHVHEWTKLFYQKALPKIDIQLRENDYVINDRKFGGNAQYFRKQRWLHHSSLLWDYDPQNMDYLLLPPKMPQYRQQRGHDHFLCRLKDFSPSQTEFETSIFNSLRANFDLQKMDYEEVNHLLNGDHRKATQYVPIST